MTKSDRALDAGTGPILVVDDEPALRGLFKRALRDAGYESLEAADGFEALEILERHSVALILLDSTMPRLDGAGVIRAIREREATRNLPVILVTAKSDLGGRSMASRQEPMTISPNRWRSTSSWPASTPGCAATPSGGRPSSGRPRTVAA